MRIKLNGNKHYHEWRKKSKGKPGSKLVKKILRNALRERSREYRLSNVSGRGMKRGY